MWQGVPIFSLGPSTYNFAEAALHFHIALAVMMNVGFAVLASQAILVVDCEKKTISQWQGISGCLSHTYTHTQTPSPHFKAEL